MNAAAKTSKSSKSPKIQSLLDEIINDNSTKEQCISRGRSQKTKFSLNQIFPDEVLPTLTPQIAGIFQEKEQPEELVVESTRRTKGDIIGFSDTEDYECDNEKVFMQQGKHKHRNELVFLLDELLRQQGIDREE